MLVFHDFITESERLELREWMLSLRQQGVLLPNIAGPFRHYRQTRAVAVTDLYTRVKARVCALAECSDESDLGHYLSCVSPGGFVHAHTDPVRDARMIHLRANVIVQHAPGGDPIVNGVMYPVLERGGWLFDAGACVHASGIIRDRVRLVMGFGFTSPRKDRP